MQGISLPQFLDFLTQCSASDFRSPKVESYLSSVRLEEDQLLPFTYFLDGEYGRNLVFKNENFELLVLTWLPGQSTAIHDHGGQRCWMFLDTGTLTFKNYAWDPALALPVGPPTTLTRSAGDNAYIDDDLGLHAISNRSSLPAISLHLYAGPVPRCRVYEEAKGRLEWVELGYTTVFGEEEAPLHESSVEPER